MTTDRTSGRAGGRRRAAGHSARRRGHVHRRGGTNPWYGTSIDFQRSLLADLDTFVEHRGQVTVDLADPRTHGAARRTGQRILVIEHAGLDVPARRELVPVRIEFHENPNYSTHGLSPMDYPRVLADPGAASKHRFNDDSLCLWFPGDPEERRWQHTDGLITLLNTVRNHLFFEDHWRATGGAGGPDQPAGEWLGDEAPHPVPCEDSAA